MPKGLQGQKHSADMVAVRLWLIATGPKSLGQDGGDAS
jgi:hypothetical protein